MPDETADSRVDIQCEKIRKTYADITALNGIDLAVTRGERFGLIGPDGAGKTTLMRILCGLIRPDAGKFSVAGFDGIRQIRSVKSNVGYMPQRFSLYPDLTVRENLKFFADLFKVTGEARRSRQERLMQFSRLEPFLSRRAGRLSGGMKQKLALSCALIHTPRVLILDEPTTGVDPVSRRDFWSILQELSERDRVTVFVSTPYLDEASRCHRIAFISDGEILEQGIPKELAERYPHPILKIRSETPFRLKHEMEDLDSVHSITIQGDHLRVSVRGGDPGEEKIRGWFREHGSYPSEVEKTRSTLEDYFIYCMKGNRGDDRVRG
ncbi:ABC transporter ATP-binding protein [bacterium]|nr:ABC transporter ATP-binding protein [candidate division CSSED10-310 bacterium]